MMIGLLVNVLVDKKGVLKMGETKLVCSRIVVVTCLIYADIIVEIIEESLWLLLRSLLLS